MHQCSSSASIPRCESHREPGCVKLVVKLLDCWCVLPWFQGGADAVHFFHKAVGAIPGNEVPNTGKCSRGFIYVTRLHMGCAKLQFTHRDADISAQWGERCCGVEFQ